MAGCQVCGDNRASCPACLGGRPEPGDMRRDPWCPKCWWLLDHPDHAEEHAAWLRAQRLRKAS